LIYSSPNVPDRPCPDVVTLLSQIREWGATVELIDGKAHVEVPMGDLEQRQERIR
jgi:hypothetical protein